MTPLPPTEPASFFQGDTVQWNKSDPNYGPPTYGLTYHFRGAVSVDITATTSSGMWLVTISPTVSATMTPGQYQYQGVAFDGAGNFYTISTGFVTVNAGLSTVTGVNDVRTFAAKALAAVEMAMLGQLPGEFQSMSINGKSLARYSKTELFVMRDRLRTEVNREKAAQGLGPSGQIHVQFQKPFPIPPTDTTFNYPIT